MYEAYNVDDTINIWCDGKCSSVDRQSIKKTTADNTASTSTDDEPLSKRARKEKNIEKIFQTLLEKHRDSEEYSHLNDPQYRLWARMHVNGFHDSLDVPPPVPAITGQSAKKKKKEESTQPLASAFAGAATAITKVLLNNRPITPPTCTSTSIKPVGVSPASKAKLSGQYLQQIHTLQELRENAAITEEEFQEQKVLLLNNLKGLHE